MPFTPDELAQISVQALDANLRSLQNVSQRTLTKAMYGDMLRQAVMDGKSVGFEENTILVNAPKTPRVWRFKHVFSNMSHRQRLSSKHERQEHTVETAGRKLLEIVGQKATYSERHDHKRGEVTATVEVDLTSIFDASVPGKHQNEILAEAKAETRNRVSEILDSAIKALDVRGDYNDDVRADQLRDIKDQLEAALSHGEDNMDASAGGLSSVGL